MIVKAGFSLIVFSTNVLIHPLHRPDHHILQQLGFVGNVSHARIDNHLDRATPTLERVVQLVSL
jgi:hypothetical protein